MKKFLIPVVLVVGFLIFIKVSTRFWNGGDKLAFVSPAGADVKVTVLDPKLSEKIALTIPGDTEVDVARGYGTLRLKNVWKLAQNERLDGGLVASTITKNFLFPVYLWSDKDLSNLSSFVFFPGETNMAFGDRLAVAMFALKVKNVDRVEIDLGKSQFLTKTKLQDGEAGFRLTGPVSERLTIYFSDNVFGGQNLKIHIVDGTGIFGVSESMGEILEVMGGKVVSVDKSGKTGVDCQVFGKDPEIVKKTARLFSCKSLKDKTDFDLEVVIGSEFARRF